MTGQAYPAVRPSDVGSYRFALPCLLDEQRAIAEILDSIDEAIEHTDRVIAATERLRDALLHELLTKGLPGQHTEWQEHRNFGTIPDGWRVMCLGDVANIQFSSVDKKSVEGEDPVRLCNYTDVFYNRRIHSGMEFMAATASPLESKRWSLKRGDVLFTKDSETRTEIGVPAYVAEDMPNILCGYHLGRARPKPGTINGRYLANAFLSTNLARQLARIANGVTRFGLTLAATKSMDFLVPPLHEQESIADILDSIDDSIDRTDQEKGTLAAFKDSISDALLTGRVRVPVYA